MKQELISYLKQVPWFSRDRQTDSQFDRWRRLELLHSSGIFPHLRV